jgi:hypothetical protein
VQVLKKFYTVPFQFVGREVRVKMTAKLVDIFDRDLNPLATHIRLLGKETHSTDTRHYPAEKLALTQFSVQVATREAIKVGPETERLVAELLSGPFPLKYLRRVQGILRLYQSGRVTREALEYAAKTGLTFNKTQYGYLQSTAEYFDKNGNRPTVVKAAPIRKEDEIHLHQKPVTS